jgi:hypothetical protein
MTKGTKIVELLSSQNYNRKNRVVGIWIKLTPLIWNPKFLVFLVLCLESFVVTAQKRITDDLTISPNYHYGYVIPEYSNLLYVVQQSVQMASLNFSKKTIGKSYWERIYNYPEYGVTLFYTTLGNDQVNGRELGLYPYFQLNIISRKKFNLFNQTGVGASYVTRKFDLQNNYLDVAIGSHLNFHFNFKFGVSYQLLQKVRVQSGLSFDHLSNGNLSEPNLGINSLTFFTGIGYSLGKKSERIKAEIPQYNPGYHWEFILSLGGKHPRSLNSDFYLTSSATLEIKWEPLRVIHLGIGADMFYDNSTEAEMSGANIPGFTAQDNFRSGLHLSQEFVYNKLSLILQQGFYLGLTDQVNHYATYNRGVVRIRATENFFVQFAMKSHLNILDFPELGLGLRWK